MRRNKKADIQQVFVYAVSVIIIGLILYFGYKAVAGFINTEKQVSFVQLKTDMERKINGISGEYEAFELDSFLVPPNIKSICFVGVDSIGDQGYSVTSFFNDTGTKNAIPLIEDSVKSGVKKNIFFIPEGEPIYVDKLKLEQGKDLLCFLPSQGKICVKLKGLGDSAQITAPPANVKC